MNAVNTNKYPTMQRAGGRSGSIDSELDKWRKLHAAGLHGKEITVMALEHISLNVSLQKP